jgi:hypothetical protein
MDFQTFAARELGAVAERMADAARLHADAAVSQAHTVFEATIERLRNDQAQLVQENERLTAENTAAIWAKREMTEKLASIFERIGDSRTVNDLIQTAAAGLADDFGRVSVMMNGERVIHFGEDERPLDPASAWVVAMPLAAHGEPVATILAGDEIGTAGAGMSLARILHRYTALALERLTDELKTLSELRSYAAMLLDEVEYVYQADLASRAPENSRVDRLKENLRCARQVFQQRVVTEGPAAALVLEDLVERRAQLRAGTPLGKDLQRLLNPKPRRNPSTAA